MERIGTVKICQVGHLVDHFGARDLAYLLSSLSKYRFIAGGDHHFRPFGGKGGRYRPSNPLLDAATSATRPSRPGFKLLPPYHRV